MAEDPLIDTQAEYEELQRFRERNKMWLRHGHSGLRVAEEVHRQIASMSADERVLFFGRLRELFCSRCGRMYGIGGGPCHCENDE